MLVSYRRLYRAQIKWIPLPRGFRLAGPWSSSDLQDLRPEALQRLACVSFLTTSGLEFLYRVDECLGMSIVITVQASKG